MERDCQTFRSTPGITDIDGDSMLTQSKPVPLNDKSKITYKEAMGGIYINGVHRMNHKGSH